MKKTFLYNQIGAEEDIINHYVNVTMKVEDLAKKYNVTVRTIQRIAKKHGVVRTVAEANKVTAKFKNYEGHKVPDHLKVKRKTLKKSIRYKMLTEHPFCKQCRRTLEEGYRLEIDHIDNNPANNNLTNLQVLCRECNQGKYFLSK